MSQSSEGARSEKPAEEAGIPGPKHNQEQPVIWERWQKKRTFVRALEERGAE